MQIICSVSLLLDLLQKKMVMALVYTVLHYQLVKWVALFWQTARVKDVALNLH